MRTTSRIFYYLFSITWLIIGAAALDAQQVNIAFNSNGLSSLQYNGTQFLAYGDLRLDQIELEDSQGNITLGSTSSTVSVNAAQQTQTRTYSWGTITAVYATSNNKLSFTITIQNNSGQTIKGIWYETLGLDFPSEPQEFGPGYPLLVNTLTGPAIQSKIGRAHV